MNVKDDIKSELTLLKTDGVYKAEDILAWAEQNRDSAIAQRLQWDDAKAGHLYRLNQVRVLIRIYVVDLKGEPATVSLSVDRVLPGGGYRDLSEVKVTPDLRKVLLEDLLRELERMADRHFDIVELHPVWEAIRQVRRNLGATQTQQERAPEPA